MGVWVVTVIMICHNDRIDWGTEDIAIAKTGVGMHRAVVSPLRQQKQVSAWTEHGFCGVQCTFTPLTPVTLLTPLRVVEAYALAKTGCEHHWATVSRSTGRQRKRGIGIGREIPVALA